LLQYFDWTFFEGVIALFVLEQELSMYA